MGVMTARAAGYLPGFEGRGRRTAGPPLGAEIAAGLKALCAAIETA